MKNLKILIVIGCITFLVSCAYYQKMYPEDLFFKDNVGRSNAAFVEQLQQDLQGRTIIEIRYVMENEDGQLRIMAVHSFDVLPAKGLIIKSVVVRLSEK